MAKTPPINQSNIIEYVFVSEDTWNPKEVKIPVPIIFETTNAVAVIQVIFFNIDSLC